MAPIQIGILSTVRRDSINEKELKMLFLLKFLIKRSPELLVPLTKKGRLIRRPTTALPRKPMWLPSAVTPHPIRLLLSGSTASTVFPNPAEEIHEHKIIELF
jgi:hypothetical protein